MIISMFSNLFKKKYKVTYEQFQLIISEVLKYRTDYGLSMYKQEGFLSDDNENPFFLEYCLYHVFIIEKQLCQKYESNFSFNLLVPFYQNLQKYLKENENIFDIRNELLLIYDKEGFIDAFHNPIYNLSKTFMKNVFNIEYDMVILQLILTDFMSSYKDLCIITDYQIINK